MLKSTIIGSAASVLLVFSVISDANTFVPQDPKTASKSVSQVQTETADNSLSKIADNDASANTGAPNSGSPNSVPLADKTISPIKNTLATPAETYTATAYSLRGNTSSGRPVSRGLIAADPRVLPMGTHVWLEAGSLTGEYVVADTGGAVRGKRIDIWTPTSGEAMRFGKRAVKLTVLQVGGKRAKPGTRSRSTNPTSLRPTSSVNQ